MCVCVYVWVRMCGCVGSAGASPPVTYVLSLVYRRHSLTPSRVNMEAAKIQYDTQKLSMCMWARRFRHTNLAEHAHHRSQRTYG